MLACSWWSAIAGCRRGQGHYELRNVTATRIRIVSVTNKGRKLVEDAEPKWRQAQEALIETIGEDRWHAMCTVLRDTTRMVRHRAVTAD